MRSLILRVVILAMIIAVPLSATAQVDVNIGISVPLPPPIAFPAPPAVIVLPETEDVYAVPDVDAEIFFWNGWWWQLWDGRWYRSRYYNRGWIYYDYVPAFYFGVDPAWRGYYHRHEWYGHRWNYQRIPAPELRKHWRSWHNNRYWERRRTWGVQNYRPHTSQQRQDLRYERRQQYQQRPDVQRHMQERRMHPPRPQGVEQRPPQSVPEQRRGRGEPQYRNAEPQHRPQGQEQPRGGHPGREYQPRQQPAGPPRGGERPHGEVQHGGAPYGGGGAQHGRGGGEGHGGGEGRPQGGGPDHGR